MNVKKCSTSLDIREIQNKTTLRFISFPVILVLIKKRTTNVGEDTDKMELIFTAGENVN